MQSTLTDVELRLRARTRIELGKLPCAGEARTWAGYVDSGRAICDLCDHPINRGDIEYEVEVSGDLASRSSRNLRFHVHCHSAWYVEIVDHGRSSSK
jgi:hypothetical protein